MMHGYASRMWKNTLRSRSSYGVENGGVGEPRLDGRGGVEHGVAPAEGGGERLLVGDVAVDRLDGGREAGGVEATEHERVHPVVAGAGQRRAQAAPHEPRRARHQHLHARTRTGRPSTIRIS